MTAAVNFCQGSRSEYIGCLPRWSDAEAVLHA
jgi:hypothetical protein